MKRRGMGALLLLVVATTLTALLASGPASAAGSPAARNPAGSKGFVTRSGSHLELDGKPFRFSGANVDWLGLIGYGPHNWGPGQTEVYPSDYEINDALATAKEMGVNVIRAQTLGDTVGCATCLEPRLGQFNEQAFRVMDYAVMRARYYGIRLIFEFIGDSRAINNGESSSVFSSWAGGANPFSSPVAIADEEGLISHILNHVNTYTGVAYKDDPTIFGWMDCNGCAAAPYATANAWVTTISSYVKSIDHNHLFIDNGGATSLTIPDVDVYATEVYPHWYDYYGLPTATTLAEKDTNMTAYVEQSAAAATAAGKAWMLSEYGWDKTDWATDADLEAFLTSVLKDQNISGDLYWDLESHASGHGWQPVPANDECQATDFDTTPPTESDPTGAGCYVNEDGNWWALYYTGIPTLSNSQSDMAQRAQILRAYAYRMRGYTITPPHDIPPAPIVTSITDGRLYWEGSAGAPDYSIEYASTPHGRWTVVCDKCVTDLSNGWPVTEAGWYRVIPYNLSDLPGPASAPYHTAGA